MAGIVAAAQRTGSRGPRETAAGYLEAARIGLQYPGRVGTTASRTLRIQNRLMGESPTLCPVRDQLREVIADLNPKPANGVISDSGAGPPGAKPSRERQLSPSGS
jgi:hypothetical protein